VASLQSAFLDFHDKIKLDDENETLRDKREILISKLKKNISDEAASYTKFNQGSYAMHTGIHPDDGDFDIDVGLKFYINKDDYSDPIKVKKWVKDALEGHTKSVEIRRSCVTVQYQQGDEPLYHVDFAVYAASNNDEKLYIAKGKENSLSENRIWEVSDPQGLIATISSRYLGKEGEQFRRIIRYLKKWRAYKFSSSGNSAPTGIALTVLAYHYFSPSSTYDSVSCVTSYDDFDALYNLVQDIKNQFSLSYDSESGEYRHSIQTSLPVEPYNDLFEKMTLKQMDSFYEKLINMISLLDEAKDKSKLSDACSVMVKVFGEDFPIKSERSIVGSTESA